MPLSYPRRDHRRAPGLPTGAVVFDVSHLGTVRVSGPDASTACRRRFTNDLGRIGPGRAQYTHLLDAGRRLGARRHHRVVGRRRAVRRHAQRLEHRAGASTPSGSGRRPTSPASGRCSPCRARRPVPGWPRWRPRRPRSAASGSPASTGTASTVVVAGTGYTGEDGVEVAVPADAAPPLWDAVVGAGVEPAGLGARDTLRLEAGLPLHGHELGPGITPLQAGLGWVVRLGQGRLPGPGGAGGREGAGVARAAAGHRRRGPPPAPRPGSRCCVGGEPVGEVTSGNFSPVLGHGIALGVPAPRRRARRRRRGRGPRGPDPRRRGRGAPFVPPAGADRPAGGPERH